MARKSMFRLMRGNQGPGTRIFIRGLEIYASIGVHPHEHETTQPVIIDVELDMGSMDAPKEDRLHETLDYGAVAQKCEDLALEAHVQLVETLASRIADWALETDPRVQACAVRIAKPQALLKAEAAGVEIIKRR